MELLTMTTPGGKAVVVYGDMDDPLALGLHVAGVDALLPRNLVHQLRETFGRWMDATSGSDR